MSNENYKLVHTLPHLGYYSNDGSVRATVKVYANESHINLQHNASDIDGPYSFDFIIPRRAALWVADSIENKFWKSPENGGLPLDQHHIKEEIDGEIIKLNRVMTVARPGQKGFDIYNLSRKVPDLEDFPMEFNTPDIMLIEGRLLKILREL